MLCMTAEEGSERVKKHMTEAQLQNLEKGKKTRFNSETGRKAQIASTAVKTRKKEMAKFATVLADTTITNEEAKKKLTDLGISGDQELCNYMLVPAAIFREAANGNMTAVEILENMLDYAEKNETADLEQTENSGARALALARAHYLDNINSTFGTISACALKHRYTHYEASGGRGSTKSSWASLTIVRLVMEHPDVHALVLRKVANTLRDSVYTQYQWAIEQLGVSEFWEARKTPLELIYLPTGQKILFRGADDPMKIKSIKPPFGYIGITHFEEKDQFSGRAEIDNILQSTMRGGKEFWNFETYNPPRSKDNWANKDSQEEKENRTQHHSTYLELDEPEWLGEAFIAEAENLRQRDEGRYQHEYLGIPVGIGGNVFENLELRAITDEELSHFDHIFQGVDWGWFPDPYAFIRLHYDKTRETIYLIDENFGNKLSNEQNARWILDHGYNDVPTTCDSAEPKSIADFRSLGVKAKEAVKGANSVEYGMKWLQSRTIVIDKRRTPHAYEEFANYEFEKNKNDEWISGYPDKNNHTIDATRYALERVANKFKSNA
jgi:PBSX family phage terminase large subunit